MQKNIKENIRGYIMDHANLSKLEDNEKIIEMNYLDSIGVVEFAAWLEKQFGIRITEEDFSEENFFDLVSMTSFVEKKKGILRQ